MNSHSIIDEHAIVTALRNIEKHANDAILIRDILAKAKEHAISPPPGSDYIQGLSIEDTTLLLAITDIELLNELFDTALSIKRAVYGNRIVLFAPLYVSNLCHGSCLYCGFRCENDALVRTSLTNEQLIAEVKALQQMGHKRLLLLMGDHPNYTFDNFIQSIETVSQVTTPPHGDIRRINVEIPALTCEQFAQLNTTDAIGTYALFQETYHHDTYRTMHPYGPKADYHYRLETMDRAIQSGMDDVGIGALFGLYDYRFEVLAMLMHAQHLDTTYGVGPHTISIPRLRPAHNTPLASSPPSTVNDKDFEKIVSVLRCAVPYTGIILSTREPPELRRRLYHLGVSQISAGSKTAPGSYNNTSNSSNEAGQFSLCDNRPLDDVVKELLQEGFIPSWCTACYRSGRTGPSFMNVAKQGLIQNCCHPNALFTLAEYLEDYASNETKELGWHTISATTTDPSTLNKLHNIRHGTRDIFV